MITFKELQRSLDQAVCEQENFKDISELFNLIEGTFYVYRTDANTVLARGIADYESAKEKANSIRKTLSLKWDQSRFSHPSVLRNTSPVRLHERFLVT